MSIRIWHPYILYVVGINQILISKSIDEQHSILDFRFAVDTKVNEYLLVIVPNCLRFNWNQTCIVPINPQVWVCQQQLLNLFVLFIELWYLAALAGYPAVLAWLPAEYYDLKMVAKESKAINRTNTQVYCWLPWGIEFVLLKVT